MNIRPTVALVGTLDTKGSEYQWMADRLAEHDVDVVVLDAGTHEPHGFDSPIDFPREALARAAGSDIDTLIAANDRGAAVTVTVTTTGPQSTRNDGKPGGVDTKLAFLGLPLLFAFGLRKRAGGLWLSLVLFAITGGVACGSLVRDSRPSQLGVPMSIRAKSVCRFTCRRLRSALGNDERAHHSRYFSGLPD